MNRILKIILTSIGLPLLVTIITLIITLSINKYIEKKEKKKILKINFLILIKDIQDLLLHLETVIIKRKILDPYALQDLNYNQILIDYNNLYHHKDDDFFIYNLLDFYNIRTKIKKQILEVVETPKISEYLDIQFNTKAQNIFTQCGYINFVENTYRELEIIFIKYKLKDQLAKWDNRFTFKSLEQIKYKRKQMLLIRKKELENNIIRIMKENNIDLTKEELDDEEKNLLRELDYLENAYNSQKSMIDYYSDYEFASLEEVYSTIKSLYQEIYNIKEETE